MNIQKFTQKSIEATQKCENIAREYGNQEIDQEHLLYALLTQDESLLTKLIVKMEIDESEFRRSVEKILEKQVKVRGGQPYISGALNDALLGAEDEAKRMGDGPASFPFHARKAEQRTEGTFQGIRHYTGSLFAGAFDRTRQSARDDRFAGGYL